MRRRKSLVFLSIVAAIALLLGAWIWHYTEPPFSKRFPVWAWRHGTLEMQAEAAQVLVNRIKPGMTYDEVLAIIGPGSDDWPRLKTYKLNGEQTVGFNVRAGYNTGIDVGFRDGKVVNAVFYD